MRLFFLHEFKKNSAAFIQQWSHVVHYLWIFNKGEIELISGTVENDAFCLDAML